MSWDPDWAPPPPSPDGLVRLPPRSQARVSTPALFWVKGSSESPGWRRREWTRDRGEGMWVPLVSRDKAPGKASQQPGLLFARGQLLQTLRPQDPQKEGGRRREPPPAQVLLAPALLPAGGRTGEEA